MVNRFRCFTHAYNLNVCYTLSHAALQRPQSDPIFLLDMRISSVLFLNKNYFLTFEQNPPRVITFIPDQNQHAGYVEVLTND